jgi:hypothetical protein
MKYFRPTIFALMLVFLGTSSAQSDIWGDAAKTIKDKSKDKYNSVGKTIRKGRDGANKYIDDKSKSLGKTYRKGRDGANKYIDDKSKSLGKSYRKGRDDTNKWVDEKTKLLHRKYKAAEKNINREAGIATENFHRERKEISRKGEETFTNIEKNTAYIVDNISTGAEYEFNKSMDKIQATEQKIHRYNEARIGSYENIGSMFEEAKKSAIDERGKAFKQITIEDFTKGAAQTGEHISENTKQVKEWGKGRLKTLGDSITTEGNRGWEYTKERGKTFDNSLRTEIGHANRIQEIDSNYFADRVDTFTDSTGAELRHATDFMTNRGKTLVNSTLVEVGRAIEELKKSPAYKYFQDRMLSLFMEQPKNIFTLGKEQPGRPIYYINGMMTSYFTARDEADALSKRLERPVHLLYNPTFCPINESANGVPEALSCPLDLPQTVYDKFWPETGMFAGSQLNQTTRELTYILYHEPSPITIVAHSQGTLITRNAILATWLLGKEKKMTSEVSWVATGIALSDHEIWPKLGLFNFYPVVNANDAISAIVGMRGGGHTLESLETKSATHEPICNYIPEISNRGRNDNFRLMTNPHDTEWLLDNLPDQNICLSYLQAGVKKNVTRSGVDNY